MGAPDVGEGRAAGVWTLAGGELIIAEPDGPATVLVPAESVLLLSVDLPLASRANRIEALPFAIEDRIAEPIEAVHLALGAELSPKRYLVGVVRHELMAAWVEAAEEAGLGHAALVPDALALPVPPEGAWSVDLGAGRAVVRASVGTGFACGAAMLRPAWEAAGRPPAIAYGDALPEDMLLAGAALDAEPLERRLLAPALDLRQGPYSRRARSGGIWRRVAWIVAIGATAHIAIAACDTLMLRVIADRRAAETRALVAEVAPGVTLGEDVPGTVSDLLPKGGGGVPQAFFPLVNRVSQALAPLAGGIEVRALGFQGNALTMDLDGSDAGLPARIDSALKGANVPATVTRAADGSVRITASAA